MKTTTEVSKPERSQPAALRNFTVADAAGSKLAGKGHSIIDDRVRLLALAAAAEAARCDSCIGGTVQELEDAGVTDDDIRKAQEIGRLVSAYAELRAFARTGGRKS